MTADQQVCHELRSLASQPLGHDGDHDVHIARSRQQTWCRARVHFSSALMSCVLLVQPLATASSSRRSRCSASVSGHCWVRVCNSRRFTAPAAPLAATALPTNVAPAPLYPDADPAELLSSTPAASAEQASAALLACWPPENRGQKPDELRASAPAAPAPQTLAAPLVGGVSEDPGPCSAALPSTAGAECGPPAMQVMVALVQGPSKALRSTGSGACSSSLTACHSPAPCQPHFMPDNAQHHLLVMQHVPMLSPLPSRLA